MCHFLTGLRSYTQENYGHQVRFLDTLHLDAILQLLLITRTLMIKKALVFCALVYAVDFVVFAAWVLSGQHPVDGFFVGALTYRLMGLLF